MTKANIDPAVLCLVLGRKKELDKDVDGALFTAEFLWLDILFF